MCERDHKGPQNSMCAILNTQRKKNRDNQLEEKKPGQTDDMKIQII